MASLKERIHSGETLIGVGVPATTTRGQLEEILAKDDYAFVSVDSQHAPYDEVQLAEFCAMAEELDVHVQFRIKHTRNTYLIGNYLDLGPCGVEVPQVESEATVQEALDNFYYPQQGIRSWGGTTRRNFNSGMSLTEYAHWWNNYGVLWMQIESINSVTNASRLAKPGVDCLSWGPADLQFNMQAHPTHPFQTDDDCVRHVLKQLEGGTIRLCYRNYDPALRNKYIDMGVTMLLERPK
jgi:2-dehydro-3-deoxyglucarate aldolase/4-hydroxy-2-oxoheptanedioate aldolase